MFTQEELKNLLIATMKAQITGQEAATIALLQQKIQQLLEEENKSLTPNKKQ